MTDYTVPVYNGTATLQYTIPAESNGTKNYTVTYNQNNQYQTKTAYGKITVGVYVDSNYTGTTENGTITNPYKDWKTAHDNMQNNQTMYILPGTHHFDTQTLIPIKNITIKAYSDDYQTLTNIPQLETIIDGGGESTALVPSRSITIQGLKFTNYNTPIYNGGVFSGNSTQAMNITRCCFTGNTAVYGGAINQNRTRGLLTINECYFKNNTATNGCGAAIYALSGTNITNSVFINNTGTNVIFSTVSNVTLDGNYFEGLSAVYGCTNTNPLMVNPFV